MGSLEYPSNLPVVSLYRITPSEGVTGRSAVEPIGIVNPSTPENVAFPKISGSVANVYLLLPFYSFKNFPIMLLHL